MLRCVLVDDEADSLEVMQWLLATYCPQVKIEAVCASAQEGIKSINEHRPDLVFLDIEMPNMNGFDMLEQFDDIFFDIVFITAYDQFAIKAFRYSALNYLLKPVDSDELVRTIERIEKMKTAPLKEQMELLLRTVQGGKQSTVPRIALTTSDGLLIVPTADIIYCESDSNYTTVVLTDKKILVSKPLKEIDETLSGPDFYRIHNSFLVNLNHIRKFVKSDGGYVVMDNGANVGISRSRRQEFIDLFSKF